MKRGGKEKEEGDGKNGKKSSLFGLFRCCSVVDWMMIMVGIVSSIVNGGSLPAFAIIMGELIDSYNPNDREGWMDDVGRVSLWFVYFSFIAFVANILQNGCWGIVSERQASKFRNLYIKCILKQDISWFDSVGSSSVVSRMNVDTLQISLGISKCGDALQYFSAFVCGITVGFVKGWLMTLGMLVGVPLLMVAAFLMMWVLKTASTKGQDSYAEAGVIAKEVLVNIRTVTSLNAQKFFLDSFGKCIFKARSIDSRKGWAGGVGIGIAIAIMYSSYGGAMRFGAFLLAETDMGYTPGTVIIVLLSVVIGSAALGQIGPSTQAIGSARGAAFLMFETLDRKPTISAPSEEHSPIKKVKGNIRFKKLSFSYDSRPDSPVLKRFDLRIKGGTTVALVGESGCGKSTVLSLLLRFYDPNKGSVTLDGRNIKDLDPLSLRNLIGLVSQEPVLFSGSIMDNIKMGQPDGASEKEVYSAAKQANAHGFISKFPDGYSTQVGEGGAKLSGGQKQRIAIARAIVKDPPILLLDEATSALDSRGEKVVQAALVKASKGRTTVVIAHRLSTIKDATQIAVLKDGHIVELGSHHQLLENEGLYSHMISIESRVSAPKIDGHALPGDDAVQCDETNDEDDSLEESDESDSGESRESAEGGDPTEAPTVPFSRLWSYAKQDTCLLIFIIIGALFLGSLAPAMAVMLGKMIGVFFRPVEEVQEAANPWLIFMLSIAGGIFVAEVIRQGFSGIAGGRMAERLRHVVLDKILRNEISWFDRDENHTAILQERLATDPYKLHTLVGDRLSLLIQNFFTLVVGAGIAFFHGWLLTFVALGCAPFIIVSEAIRMRLLRGFEKGEHLEEAMKVISESLGNIRTILAFTLETYVIESYSTALKKANSKIIKKEALKAGFSGIPYLIIFNSYALSFWVGSYLVSEDYMEFDDMMTVFVAIMMTAQLIGHTSGTLQEVPAAKKAVSKIFAIIDRETRMDPFSSQGKTPKKKTKKASSIEFKRVTFAYPTRPSDTVFDRLSLIIPAGKVVALVGRSGEGKSTAVQLLEKFYSPKSGKILFDGHDLENLNTEWWRKQIGLVSQEPVLFDGTIMYNIQIGNPDASFEDVVTAAKQANAHKFISSFSEGYDTVVGTKGSDSTKLSGGQKQRIAIARALIRNPQVLLLDEATSSLDPTGEKEVQEALTKVTRRKKGHSITTLIVAHRLSTIRNADLIAVLERGVVVEKGTHEELMALGESGQYFQLVERQTQTTEID